MGKPTNIEWADDTVNPTSGCDGCELWTPGQGGPCYAGNLHQGRLALSLPLLYDPDFNQVRLIPGRVGKALRCMDLAGRPRPTKPWLDGRRRKIFVGDLGDIFSQAVPFEYLRDEIVANAASPSGRRHDLLLLTKQPRRAAQFAAWLGQPWPANVWIGTSLTGRASRARIPSLRAVPAARRFLSIEPLIEDPGLTAADLAGIAWVIVGGESDQGRWAARSFDPAWARALRDLCQACGVAFFLKQLGSRPRGIVLHDRHGGDWAEWDADLRVRQLPPEV